MKFQLGTVVLLLCLFTFNINASAMSQSAISSTHVLKQDSVLRHVVLFKYKAGSTSKDIEKVQQSFVDLKTKIPQIVSLEWGVNNSPEGLDKGFTHCFFLTFRSEEDRDAYLPHPDHKAFGEVIGPFLEDVLVVDYWTH
ncbi:Dabb family protein [Muriicola sp. E247]|uniref:Dabb family protein n=1 Tax=Muriicola sp. E247 TaxID=3242730 RepID=UPI00352313E7